MPSANYTFGLGKPRVKIAPELASEENLISHLKITGKELQKIRIANILMYTVFEVKSKNKTRVIYAPDKRLKYLQTEISSLLSLSYTPRKSTHGFIKGRSIRSNAEVHAGKRHLLNIDLKDFFPSISQNRVHGLLGSGCIDFRFTA